MCWLDEEEKKEEKRGREEGRNRRARDRTGGDNG